MVLAIFLADRGQGYQIKNGVGRHGAHEGFFDIDGLGSTGASDDIGLENGTVKNGCVSGGNPVGAESAFCLQKRRMHDRSNDGSRGHEQKTGTGTLGRKATDCHLTGSCSAGGNGQAVEAGIVSAVILRRIGIQTKVRVRFPAEGFTVVQLYRIQGIAETVLQRSSFIGARIIAADVNPADFDLAVDQHVAGFEITRQLGDSVEGEWMDIHSLQIDRTLTYIHAHIAGLKLTYRIKHRLDAIGQIPGHVLGFHGNRIALVVTGNRNQKAGSGGGSGNR